MESLNIQVRQGPALGIPAQVVAAFAFADIGWVSGSKASGVGRGVEGVGVRA